MQTIADAFIESVNQQETEQEKEEFINHTLISIFDSFSDTMLSNSIKKLQDYQDRHKGE